MIWVTMKLSTISNRQSTTKTISEIISQVVRSSSNRTFHKKRTYNKDLRREVIFIVFLEIYLVIYYFIFIYKYYNTNNF